MMFSSISKRRPKFDGKQIIESLYEGILGRKADVEGVAAYTHALHGGKPLALLVSEMLSSAEYKSRHFGSAAIALQTSEIVDALYQAILGRKADDSGLAEYTRALRSGKPLKHIVSSILSSEEYKSRQSNSTATFPTIELPDLTSIYKEKYIRKDDHSSIFEVASDDDFRFFESLIAEHRYYDSFGVWSSAIDLDKEVTAAIVQGLGATSCVELGCFNGPVLSLLDKKGIDVCGIDVSHLAFVLAYENIHRKLRYGTLLELNFDAQYDVFLGMDILEHLNPLDLDDNVARIASLVKRDGFAYVNSPMFGEDRTFGTVFQQYLPEWRESGNSSFWRQIHCDARGWPMHGHLVWAHPSWWEQLFLRHGLVRETAIELAIHSILKAFFDKNAPARRSLFVLRHADSNPPVESICNELRTQISAVL